MLNLEKEILHILSRWVVAKAKSEETGEGLHGTMVDMGVYESFDELMYCLSTGKGKLPTGGEYQSSLQPSPAVKDERFLSHLLGKISDEGKIIGELPGKLASDSSDRSRRLLALMRRQQRQWPELRKATESLYKVASDIECKAAEVTSLTTAIYDAGGLYERES